MIVVTPPHINIASTPLGNMVTHSALLSRNLIRLADHRAGWRDPVRWI